MPLPPPNQVDFSDCETEHHRIISNLITKLFKKFFKKLENSSSTSLNFLAYFWFLELVFMWACVLTKSDSVLEGCLAGDAGRRDLDLPWSH